MNPSVLYLGVDVHENESQVAVFEKEGRLLQEKRLPTKRLAKFVSSLPGEKHVGLESVGFVYPIYDDLVKTGSEVVVANPNSIQLIAKTRIKHDRVDARVLETEKKKNRLVLYLLSRRQKDLLAIGGGAGESRSGNAPRIGLAGARWSRTQLL